MKTKQLFKRILSWSLAGAAALSLTVFAHAETATAAEAPVAANMVGKTFTADGKRTPEEGWTEVPTLVSDSQTLGVDGTELLPLKTWIGTDGTNLYYFAEAQNADSYNKLVEVQIDFLNTDTEKNENGTEKYTVDSYREMLEAEKTVGKYSMWSKFDKWIDSKGGPGYYHVHQDGKIACGDAYQSNEWSGIIKAHKEVWSDDLFTVEFKVELPDYIKKALKNGTYAIGAESAADYKGTWSPSQYAEGVLSDDGNYLEPARLRDVVLPCTASAVGELIGYQIAAMTEGYSVRFLSTLEGTDYTEYAEVGFRFELNGKTVEKSCRSVYHTVLANYGAEQVRANTYGATYLYACTVEGLSATGTYAFTVTPWTLKAGETEKTYGTPCTVTIQNGAAVTE